MALRTLLLPLLALTPVPPPTVDPAEVLILGTFHMEAKGDALNPTVKDLLGERRQAEIAALVQSLAGFQPDKVALEAVPGAPVLDEFESYRAGELEPRAHEYHQVGFRLAQSMQHEVVHGIDHHAPIDPQEVLAWALENGQALLATKTMAAYATFASRWSARFMAKSTMLEIYRAFNDPQTDEDSHAIFTSMLRIGSEEEPIGATTLARWHERNIRIADQIVRLAEPGERIVVIIGAHHRKLLIETLRRIPGIEVVDTESYLEG